ncbi:hypothetical protein GWN19_04925 [Candidatus Bathyarchaeota archaeon]|nr:hypothetical protein [Candidatus Bathyarchaeota archaeon]
MPPPSLHLRGHHQGNVGLCIFSIQAVKQTFVAAIFTLLLAKLKILSMASAGNCASATKIGKNIIL